VTPWLEPPLAVDVLHAVLDRLDAQARIGFAGRGRDETTAIDQEAEDAVVERLGVHGGDFVLVSEELGERAFGAGGERRVIVDPIDGSVNAKRGIPFFSFSLAVAEGPTMRDVTFGYVYDFGTAEEWTASGRGAFLAEAARRPGPRIDRDPLSRHDRVVIAGATGGGGGSPAGHGLLLSPLPPRGGRVDAVCSSRPPVVDIAAAAARARARRRQLFDDPRSSTARSTSSRSRIAAAGPGLVADLASALG
jgi:myo-inositol-1(or 4)-monophosphatase